MCPSEVNDRLEMSAEFAEIGLPAVPFATVAIDQSVPSSLDCNAVGADAEEDADEDVLDVLDVGGVLDGGDVLDVGGELGAEWAPRRTTVTVPAINTTAAAIPTTAKRRRVRLGFDFGGLASTVLSTASECGAKRSRAENASRSSSGFNSHSPIVAVTARKAANPRAAQDRTVDCEQPISAAIWSSGRSM
jgi:hypothetical protein